MEGKIPKIKDGASVEIINRVAHFINHESHELDIGKLRILFDEETIANVCKLDLDYMEEDKLLWTATKSRVFSTKSVYSSCMRVKLETTVYEVWKKIWTSKLHERLKLFLWRLASDCLPTKANIWGRTHKGDNICILCGDAEETTLHLFTRCSVSRVVAFASNMGIQLDETDTHNTEALVLWCLSLPCHEEPNMSVYHGLLLSCHMVHEK